MPDPAVAALRHYARDLFLDGQTPVRPSAQTEAAAERRSIEADGGTIHTQAVVHAGGGIWVVRTEFTKEEPTR
jgi:hypothetical protein